MDKNNKTPTINTIPLRPMDGVEFYAAVLIVQEKRGPNGELWIFGSGCDYPRLAMESTGFANNPQWSFDGIRALDMAGRYDFLKEEILDDRN